MVSEHLKTVNVNKKNRDITLSFTFLSAFSMGLSLK